ncbi:hypothetical protein TNIN_6651 [Trichonephila inaurata madagascariensis]|uniref:Uncharacterized protein n=1 Tax=Trichonephila inaurata madagascariensis TaxID=2747483 RepID=A0A8X6IAZ3_9ARAC|nr:hypothetical protein TNIN_6651 [Trichonephila inaurata madagascariensis]
MSVVRLKTLFWEIERRKLASGHLQKPETGATLIYATSAINFNGRSDRAYALLCPGGSNEGLKDGAVREARPTFPDVRGQVEDIFLGEIERRKTSLWSSTQPETGATLIYATSAINFNGRFDRAYPLFCVLQRD